ncbi:cell wall-active antibiotics response protein LiaF [Oceanobacillus kapialis]|uniref:cell wall-active antibiotics response protein LiaF n=1 Tax=Oceanobacillus kapialis TaxID=481353 RepID=UPI0038505CAC
MKGFVRYFLAVLLIALGVMLVLSNIGLLAFDFNSAWLYIYPAFFVVIGWKWLWDYWKRRGGSWIFGSLFLIAGILLLLDRFEIISFTFGDIFKLWPLLIIYVGFLLIGRKNSVIVVKSKKDKDSSTKSSSTNSSFFSVGSYEYTDPNWKLEPINISNMAGDFYFDFSKAFIPEKKTPVSINSLAGDVTIIIPEDVAFRVHASVKAGDIEVVGKNVDGINRSLDFETDGYEDAVQKIDFHIRLKAGSIRIDYV